MEKELQKIKVWCLLRDQQGHVKPVEEYFGDRAEFIYDSDRVPEKLVSASPDIVLCVNDFHYDVVRCIEAGRAHGIPSIVLQDGILEWRCQYENPLFGSGGGAPQHQPVMADKIACIGYQSARQIAAWGNCEKVEVTGMPRMDRPVHYPFSKPNFPAKRILVMTAKKPWFNDQQKEVTLRSLLDLKNYFQRHPEVEVIWRLTKNVQEMIGVENHLTELGGMELLDLLNHVDAVITTLSTTVVESMLSNRPVAVLDYHNIPRFIPFCWSITSKEQIDSIVEEISNPAANKMAFQNDCLEDILRRDQPAAKITAELIEKMVMLKGRAISNQKSLDLPANLLEYNGIFPQGNHINLQRFYPEQKIFQVTNIKELQVKIARLEKENENLKGKLNSVNIMSWFISVAHFIKRRFFL